jgi:hypothetical protein
MSIVPERAIEDAGFYLCGGICHFRLVADKVNGALPAGNQPQQLPLPFSRIGGPI